MSILSRFIQSEAGFITAKNRMYIQLHEYDIRAEIYIRPSLKNLVGMEDFIQNEFHIRYY